VTGEEFDKAVVPEDMTHPESVNFTLKIFN